MSSHNSVNIYTLSETPTLFKFLSFIPLLFSVHVLRGRHRIVAAVGDTVMNTRKSLLS